ncbi:MAG: glycosyltransferase family 4 protein [Clostridia bacterium]|nr:glycosyltransferase family 4 protein [Clostridia bacterium]
MKILVVCQYYSPEPFRHPDICEELARRGNDVFVVTGTPNYPMGRVYPGYEKGKRKDEVINGVRVHRCKTVERKNSAIFRILNYLSFVFYSTRYIKKLKESFDVVFVNQLSPVIMAKAAIKYKRKQNVPMVLYCLDLWPESAVVGGVKKGDPAYKLLHRISEKIYKSADRILVSSRYFSEYFEKEFGISDTVHLPQYAEEIFSPDNCFKEPDGSVDLMFAGNIGAAQSVDTIIDAAALLTGIKNLKIHIVGDGSELERLKAKAKDMPQIIFHGRHPIEKMPEYYAMADACLVTLKSGELAATLPGKVQTYFAAGKPVIAAADGETERVIAESESGFCGAAEDSKALAENIKRFAEADKQKLSQNARGYYEKNYSKKAFVNELEKALESYASNNTEKR